LSTLLAASGSLLLAFALDACGSPGSDPLIEFQSRPPRPLPSAGPSPGPSTSAGGCPDYVFCIRGDHWDTDRCRCVPDEDDAGAMQDASVPSEAAVDAGSTTPDSGGHASGDGASSTDACPPDAAMSDAAMTPEEAGTACDGSACSAP
jgi:hypothetical protein